MREYTIKRGHTKNISEVIATYYGVKGDIAEGIDFSVEGIGDIYMKQQKNKLIIDITPPKNVLGDYSIIKKWNDFLFDATGKTVKERKKEFGKVK